MLFRPWIIMKLMLSSIYRHLVWIWGVGFLGPVFMIFLFTVFVDLGMLDCVGLFFVLFLFRYSCVSQAT